MKNCNTMNKFNWNLEHKETIFKKIETYETVDKHLLYGFINNNMGITYRNNKKYESLGIKFESEQIQMANYLGLEKDGYFYTTYNLPSHRWGRINPKNSLSLCVFRRGTRHKLAEGNYIDIDMVNCHSNIYLAFCKHHNLPCSELQKYCDDPKILRQTIIKHHIPEMLKKPNDKELKDIAKNLPIRLANGGTYKQWMTDFNITNREPHKQILALEEELKNIMDIVYKNNKDILTDVLANKKNLVHMHGDEINKYKRTVMSLWSQTIERYLQEEAIKYVSEWVHIESIIPCQDGFMIPKGWEWDTIIEDINEHVNSIYPYNIKFMIKPFDEPLNIPRHPNLDKPLQTRNTDETDFFKLPYPKKEITQQKLSLPYDEFEASDIYIIESGTGTGKSSLIASLYGEYKNNHPESKILMISNLTSILEQLQKTFKTANIPITNYLGDDTDGTNILKNDSVICINSILKIADMDYSNTIVYIDEITNLLFNMTGNNTMINVKAIFSMFIKIFTQCKKVIITDAHLTKPITRLIELRKTSDEDITYYLNNYKKYTGTQATHVQDGRVFLNKMIQRVERGEKFIFASDSKKMANTFYVECLEHAKEEDKNKFFLITKDTKDIDITKINYNDSFVFMSPRVTCGLSIISSSNLDSFIYIQGKSINPISLYQQATRNRTMKHLYFFISSQTMKPRQFLSYETCKTYFRILIKDFEHLTNNCVMTDDCENDIILDNFYFNLHTGKEYINSLLFTDIHYHFTQELLKAGFNVLTNTEVSDIKPQESKEMMKRAFKDMETRQFEEVKDVIDGGFIGINPENTVRRRCDFLNIKDSEQMETYSEILKNDIMFENFITFDRALRSKDYIENKITELKNNKHSVDIYNNEYTKILLIRQFEELFNIDPMDIDNITPTMCKFKPTLLSHIKNKFRWKKVNIETIKDVLNVYKKMIVNVCGKLGLIDKVRTQSKGNRTRVATYVREELQSIMDLIILKNHEHLGAYDQSILTVMDKYIDISKSVNRTARPKYIIPVRFFEDS